VNEPAVAAELLTEAKLTVSDLAVTAFASVNENVAVPAAPVVIAAYVVAAE
jgi:hypothetical protein